MKSSRLPQASAFILSVFLAAALFLGTACTKSGGNSGAKGGAQAIPVQAGTITRQTLPLLHVSVGLIQAERSVGVKSQVDGVVREILFKEGAPIKAGDPLLNLDRRSFENALQIARADLTNANAEAERAAADAERYERLGKTQNVSAELLNQFTTKRDTSRALVVAKQAAVSNAELQLSYASILAPISGITGQLTVHEGALVKANDSANSLLTINQISPIEVAFSVPERVLTNVRKATNRGPVNVRILPQTDGAQPLTGQLSFIDNTVDSTTGTILLKAEFANSDTTLWPGQFVQVETELGADIDVLVAPAGTLQVGQQGTQAFVITQENSIELRPVKAGRSSGGFTIILDGLKEGERVVTDGHLRLTPKAKVDIRTLESAAAPTASADKSTPRKP